MVQGTRADFQHQHTAIALLVVEIAVSSVAADRECASLYAEADIGEYRIVLAETQQVEVRRRPLSGVYQDLRLYDLYEALMCGTVPGVTVSLPQLFSQQG